MLAILVILFVCTGQATYPLEKKKRSVITFVVLNENCGWFKKIEKKIPFYSFTVLLFYFYRLALSAGSTLVIFRTQNYCFGNESSNYFTTEQFLMTLF